GSLGTLVKLPREIRQTVFSFALDIDIDRPVTNKTCCSAESTKRERDACKKHGETQVKDAGRFNLLQVSKKVAEEASWVLYNQGRLRLDMGCALRPYFAKYRPKTTRRLGDVPHSEKVHNMWMAVARYRFVDLEINPKMLKTENPEIYTAQLCEAASLLLKSWEKEAKQPTSEIPHIVTVNLGDFFDSTVPFNADDDSDMVEEVDLWTVINFPGEPPDFRRLAASSCQNLKRLLSIVDRNRGRSEWKIVALSEIEKEGGAKWLKTFRRDCQRSGVDFEGRTREEVEME
ncbi:hypothetical protein K505DRAFT_257963, partial [Melanomma pulvis-pyrius CBS 109.77]